MGPKKKGGKANKLARMTDEQRERYLQHRAAIEEETRRRKEQLIATFMRNKLKREEAFTRINSAKINQHWRHILRRIKCSELKEDVENLWLGFQRTMDKKQLQKDELLSSLEVAERQYSDTLQSHMEVIEKLINVHSEHVSNLHSLFLSKLSELLKKAVDERALINVTFERETQKLQMISSRMDLESNSLSRKMQKYERVNKLSEMNRKYVEEWKMLVAVSEQKVEDIWQQIREHLRSYTVTTAAKRKTVQQVFNADQDWVTTLTNIQQTSRKLGKMKEKAENKMNEILERNKSLQKERESLFTCHKTLVERFEKEKKRDDEKFQHLVVISEETLQHLKSIQNTGEKALALMSLCQRFESEIERRAPLCTHQQNLNKTIEEEDTEDEEKQDLIEKEMQVFRKLDNFWKRYNKVFVEVSNVRMERDLLALENQQLRSTLHAYLLDMASVDSCGAPTGHRISTGRPHTSVQSRFSNMLKIHPRPLSSVSVGPSTLSPAVSAVSRFSFSHASSAAKAAVLSNSPSSLSSNSNQWSL